MMTDRRSRNSCVYLWRYYLYLQHHNFYKSYLSFLLSCECKSNSPAYHGQFFFTTVGEIEKAAYMLCIVYERTLKHLTTRRKRIVKFITLCLYLYFIIVL